MDLLIVIVVGAAVAAIAALVIRGSNASAQPKPVMRAADHPAFGGSGTPDPAAPKSGSCLGCGGDLYSLGVDRLRVGGSSAGAHVLLGDWAELGERMLDVEFLACPQCRRVELRLPSRD